MTPTTPPGPDADVVTELVVCTTCRPASAPRDEPAAGEVLLHQVQQQAAASPAHARLRVRGTACLSACSRACTVALMAPDKHSYVFGDLAPDAVGAALDTAAQILACARQHADAPDGLLAWRARPERLRRVVARLPPLDSPVSPVTEPLEP